MFADLVTLAILEKGRRGGAGLGLGLGVSLVLFLDWGELLLLGFGGSFLGDFAERKG